MWSSLNRFRLCFLVLARAGYVQVADTSRKRKSFHCNIHTWNLNWFHLHILFHCIQTYLALILCGGSLVFLFLCNHFMMRASRFYANHTFSLCFKGSIMPLNGVEKNSYGTLLYIIIGQEGKHSSFITCFINILLIYVFFSFCLVV